MKEHKRYHAWLVAGVVGLPLAGCAPEVTEPPAPVERVVQAPDGVPLHYDVTGNGAVALVFVHCWTCDRSFWDAQVPHFAPNYTVVRVELAGHGKSGHGRKRYDMAGFGADVAAVVDDLGLSRVVLIGHSMGGPVSVEAARRLGGRVIGVVGVDTFYTGFQYPDDDQVIAGFVAPFEQDFAGTVAAMVRAYFPPGTDEQLVKRVVTHMQGADQTMAIGAMYDIFYWSRREVPAALDGLGKRLRNLNGDLGQENRPRHDSVVLIPGTGHFPHMEKPDAFNTALETIVEQF